ncbi:MAG TPA: SpoIID/LytB domain-containing protein [Acidimicrobiales bacterium]|nr:SpoIID/LytB domain-containing protein [Acidimicrobiales bacterium]
MFAAVALGLGCVLLSICGFVAPATAQTSWARTSTGWTAERMRFEPSGGSTGITVGGVGTFRGSIEVVRSAAGLAIVNEVSFDDYVKGISEVPNSWPIEALKAQAIAARTYALWEYHRQGAGAYRAAGAHICATQACQVYTGLAKEQSPNSERWVAAVEATTSQVLWWRNAPIVAKYSSSNGGEAVDGGRPYLRAFADPDDAHSPLHRWQVQVGTAQLAAAFGLAPRTIVAIQRAGDEILMTAKHDPANPEEPPAHLTVAAGDFRARVNEAVPTPSHVPRTLPTVRFAPSIAADGTAVVFDGRGWGHGIGMSQWGAYGKAARGMKAPEILASYYAGLKPVTLPASHMPQTIKVAIAIDAGSTTISPATDEGRLKVTAAGDEPIAHGDRAGWTVRPTGAGVAVEALDAAARESSAAVTPAPEAALTATIGAPIEVPAQLSDGARVAARATPPGATEPIALGEPKVFDAGTLTLRLPPAAQPGAYTITIDTDRGGGRTGTSTITIDVTAGPTGGATDAPDAGETDGNERLEAIAGGPEASLWPLTSRSAPATPVKIAGALALLALAGTSAGVAKVALGRFRPAPLH